MMGGICKRKRSTVLVEMANKGSLVVFCSSLGKGGGSSGGG